jgi:streptomycin 6-kinase
MATFQENVVQTWGQAGRAWLEQLPRITTILAERWHLTDLQPASNLSYNYILLGYQHSKPIALKIGFDAQALRQEMVALQAYHGIGCVQLIDSTFDMYNALLIERAVPGTSLALLFPEHDDQAVAYAATIMQQLHSAQMPIDVRVPHIQDWLKDLENPHPTLVDHYHLKKAQAMVQHLLATQAAPVLLHGDLHHHNILATSDHWTAIDPKGVVGEPAYEVGAFIRNPLPEILQQQEAAVLLQRRLTLFAQLLGIDYQRLHAWSYVQAVLASCWAMQDGQADVAKIMEEVATILDGLSQKSE